MGRKTKCTKSVIAAVCEALRHGLTFESSCQLANISKQTGYDWMKRGEDDEEPFLTFLDAVKKAQVQGEFALVQIIQHAAPKSWQAAAWLLERRFPARWGRRIVLPEESNDGNSGDLDYARKLQRMTPEQKEVRINELLAKRERGLMEKTCSLAPPLPTVS